MRIQLQANSNNLELENLEHGYSFSYENDINHRQSWAVKIGGMLEKLFSKNLENEDVQIAKLIVKSSNFLNDNMDRPELLKDIKVQINIDSPFNQFIRKYTPYVEKLNRNFANEILTGTNINAGHATNKNIFIGTGLFSQKEEFSFIYYIKEKLGLEKVVFFTVFHEASHTFQPNMPNDYSITFNTILSHSCKLAICNDRSLRELNEDISEYSIPHKALDKDYFKQIHSLKQEIYADAGAILLLRNKEFINNSYKKEESLETIDTIIEARIKDQFKTRKNSSANHYVSNFHHFTSPGISYLKENYDSLPQRVMTQVEINSYSQKCIEQGVSRILLSSITANNENTEQLNTLFRFEDSYRDGFLKIGLKKDINFIKELETLAGADWVKNFKDNVKIIEKENLSSSDLVEAKWHAGTNPCEFKNQLKKARINQVFKSMENMRDLANSFSQTNLKL